MFLQSKLFRFISTSLIILSVAVFAFADTIKLKDGSVIKGKIVSFENGQFVIVIGDGSRQRQMRFFADEIENIIFDSEAIPTTSSNNDINIEKKPSYTEKTDGNKTIITVGSAPRTNPTPTMPDEDEITDDDVIDDGSNNSSNTTTSAQPIALSVKVLADNTANGWTNAGWVVRKGQRIRISGNGRISLGNGRYSGPRGISTLPDENKLMQDQPTGGLIAVIGDDNNDFIFVGEDHEFVATRDGALFLGINEGVLNDNTGSLDVTIEISTMLEGK